MNQDTTYPATFEGLLDLVARLRAPDGCPWDREQTSESLKGGFLEECYEVLEAIDQGEPHRLLEELGDVLLHVALQVQMAREAGLFSQEDVFETQTSKLIRRHPHVFGDASAEDAEEVEAQWEDIKNRERSGDSRSLLDGVPRSMPALAYAQTIQKRAARVGFDWQDTDGVLEKVREELDELAGAEDPSGREAELGDVLFSLVNVGRWLGVDAEGALRRADAHFYRRFGHMEELSRERGVSFADLSPQEKEDLWQEAKRAIG